MFFSMFVYSGGSWEPIQKCGILCTHLLLLAYDFSHLIWQPNTGQSG